MKGWTLHVGASSFRAEDVDFCYQKMPFSDSQACKTYLT